jgi:hypothetical protein
MRVFLIAFFLGNILTADVVETRRYSWGPQEYLKSGFRSAPWVRDPFFPSQKKFKLKGIISGELAYINNRWVREGDKLEGYTVKSITAESVALMKQAELVVLKIHGEEGKQ